MSRYRFPTGNGYISGIPLTPPRDSSGCAMLHSSNRENLKNPKSHYPRVYCHHQKSFSSFEMSVLTFLGRVFIFFVRNICSDISCLRVFIRNICSNISSLRIFMSGSWTGLSVLCLHVFVSGSWTSSCLMSSFRHRCFSFRCSSFRHPKFPPFGR